MARSAMWPWQLLSGVHFTSWYLQLPMTCGRGAPDHEMMPRKIIAAIWSPSEIFLIQGSLGSK